MLSMDSAVKHSVMSDSLWPHGLAPLSMGLSRQEYQSGLSFPPPGDPLDPRIEPTFPGVPALAGGFFTTWEALLTVDTSLHTVLIP